MSNEFNFGCRLQTKLGNRGNQNTFLICNTNLKSTFMPKTTHYNMQYCLNDLTYFSKITALWTSVVGGEKPAQRIETANKIQRTH